MNILCNTIIQLIILYAKCIRQMCLIGEGFLHYIYTPPSALYNMKCTDSFIKANKNKIPLI